MCSKPLNDKDSAIVLDLIKTYVLRLVYCTQFFRSLCLFEMMQTCRLHSEALQGGIKRHHT